MLRRLRYQGYLVTHLDPPDTKAGHVELAEKTNPYHCSVVLARQTPWQNWRVSWKPNPPEKSRWKRTLQAIIDGVDPDQRGGIDSPDDLCSRAWLGRKDVSTVGRELAKLGNSEATGPKARQLAVDVIQWLAEDPRKWVTTIAQADAILAAALCDKSGKGYGNAAGRLGKSTTNWPLYEQSGYLDIEQTLVRRLRGPGLMSTPSREPAAMSRTLLRLESYLAQVATRSESVSLVVISDAAGAGKSELVRQMRTAWESSRARKIPFYAPIGSTLAAHITSMDFGNARIGPSDLAAALNDQLHEIEPAHPKGMGPKDAAIQLLDALVMSQARRVPESEDQEPNLIILDNLASVEPISVLMEAANAPGRIVELVLLVTCRRDLKDRLSGYWFHDFHVSPLDRADALAILTHGLPRFAPSSENALSAVTEKLLYWPSALAAANRVLSDGSPTVGVLTARIRSLLGLLAIRDVELRALVHNPDALGQALRGLDQTHSREPFAEYALRRQNWLREEAKREGLPIKFDLAGQFVSLGIGLPGRGENRPRATDIVDAIQKMEVADPEQRLFVLTGPPGSGKTTILRRTEWNQLQASLPTIEGAPLVLYVPLNAVPAGADPRSWLYDVWWPAHQVSLPGLAAVMEQKPVWLCLDAANELKPTANEDVAARMATWVDRINDLLPPSGAWGQQHRAIFSCRQRDIGNVFANAGQFTIEAMDDYQLAEFLDRYLNDTVNREEALKQIRALRWRESTSGVVAVYRLPLWLELLCDHINDVGFRKLPGSRADLMSGLIRRRLQTERNKRVGPLVDHNLLITRDQWRMIDDRAQESHFLKPLGGKLLVSLEALACGVLAEGGASIVVRRAHELIGAPARVVLDAAQRSLDLIRCQRTLGEMDGDEPDADLTVIEFAHHQFLEYFAGRSIARTGSIELSKIRQNLGEIGQWDEPLLFACAMIDDVRLPDFIRGIHTSNLALAARCAGQAGTKERLEEGNANLLNSLVRELQGCLTSAASTSRNERIACAEALFDVGHPDYGIHVTKFAGETTRFVLPAAHARIRIKADEYVVGAEDLTDDERPCHVFSIAKDFWFAKYPVTNCEYACFVEAGGYTDPKWWDECSASEHRRVHGANQRIVQRMIDRAKQIKALSLEEYERSMRYNEHQTQWRHWYEKRRTTPIEKLETDFHRDYPPGRNEPRPHFWLDPGFNGLGQPVVGVDFYEARAYSRWLNAMCSTSSLNLACDLPNEDEWEAACAGTQHWMWSANADVFDSTRYNTAEEIEGELPVGKTTPVGAYPQGATPQGVHDLCGNIWEWTLTEYVSGRARDVRAGNENDPKRDVPFRVVRGGSWRRNQYYARAARRSSNGPFDRSYAIGFRLVFRPVS